MSTASRRGAGDQPASRPGAPVPAPPAAYTWEPTSDALAERYGLPVESIARFDLNTSPSPPDLVWPLLRGGRFAAPLSEYPPTDYRNLVEAAADRYGVAPDELLVGAGADEVLDVACKALLPPQGTALVTPPTYSYYRVLSEQRRGRILAVPRRPAAEGHALDVPGIRRAAVDADLLWICNPNNPTALVDPLERVAGLLDGLRDDALRAGRRPPFVVIDEAYAEYVGWSCVSLRVDHPNLIVARTVSKAYALAGIRVGFAVARADTIALLEPYRPPNSVSVVSLTLAEAALRDSPALEDNLSRIEAERGRLGAELTRAGWAVQPSVTNFLLVPFASPDAAERTGEELRRRGLVPRTFGEGHVLADHLRFTVRGPAENDRLIAAARDLARGGLASPSPDRAAGSARRPDASSLEDRG